MASNKRFEVVYNQTGGFLGVSQQTILVDKETGVHYLYVENGHSGGLTPLLGADGKPVITRSTLDRESV